MIYSEMTRKAMKIAFEAHIGQLDKTGIPYIYHPIHLAEQMGFEERTIVALLHDALEGKPKEINRKKIRHKFGKKVLKMIEVSTDTPKDYAGGQKPPWKNEK